MANRKFEQPDGLHAHGTRAFDIYCEENEDHMRKTDTLVLAQFCKLEDLIHDLNEKAKNNEKGAVVQLAIALDKYLLFSDRLALTHVDRVKRKLELSKIDSAKKKDKSEAKIAATRPKTAMSDLTPAKLGVKGTNGTPASTK